MLCLMSFKQLKLRGEGTLHRDLSSWLTQSFNTAARELLNQEQRLPACGASQLFPAEFQEKSRNAKNQEKGLPGERAHSLPLR